MLAFDALVLATHDASLAAGALRSIGAEGASDAASAAQEQQQLKSLADALQAQRDHGTAPVFSWSGVFPAGTSDALPFDAVCVPGSAVVQFLYRSASKPGRPALEDGGELWTAVSTPAFAAELLRREGPAAEAQKGDSDRGGGAALAATNLMASEVSALLAGGGAPPKPLRAVAKRWGAGFAAGSLQHGHHCIALPPWQLAIAGDFVCARDSPTEAAALSGLAAGETIALSIAT